MLKYSPNMVNFYQILKKGGRHEKRREIKKIYQTSSIKNGRSCDSRYRSEQYGTAFQVLETLKNGLDPYNVLNPGKMGFGPTV